MKFSRKIEPEVNEDKDIYSVKLSLPAWELIPDINLYSEQVIHIVNESLKDNIIFGNEIDFNESFITSTMINNYVKNELISPPENKRYSREQIAKLIVISLLKQVYSTDDIIKFLEITHSTVPVERAYTSFVRLLVESVGMVFLEGKRVEEDSKIIENTYREFLKDQFNIETKEQALLKTVTLSIAHRIYIQEYLNRLEDNKE